MSGGGELRFVVSAAEAGERLDRYVASRAQGLSRTRVQALVEEGLVLVDGRPERPSHAVRVGDEVVLRLPPPRDPGIRPEPIPLDVLHEDDDILVLVKPAGIVVHPAAGHESGTLVNALLAHCGERLSGIGGERRPGIVHRLDKGTSGVLVVAKTDAAHLDLSRQFHDRTVKKTYLALVWGEMDRRSGRAESAIGRHPRQRRKMAVVEGEGGRPSRTSWRVLDEAAGFSLLEVSLHTGRTHQIRVHLEEAGHPVVGDVAYGGRREKGLRDPALRRAIGELGRPFLHAARLEFRHPRTGRTLTFEAPLAPELADLLSLVRTSRV